jgi:Protein of unknown function (DUF4058)
MLSPFPGMDPYLDDPRFFPDFHDSLLIFIKQDLQGRLPETYYAQSGQYVWLETSRRVVQPDVHVMSERRRRRPRPRRAGKGGVAVAEVEATHPVVIAVETIEHDEHIERLVDVYERRSGQDRLVATIEVVSPAKKTRGHPGYDKYREKQREVLEAQAHLIEIDLLRKGTHVTTVPRDLAREEAGPFDYHVSVHRFDRPQEYFFYPILLERRLPAITIPLLPGDPEVLLDLQAAFNRAYDAGPFRRWIRYGDDPIRLPLRPEQARWAKALMKRR